MLCIAADLLRQFKAFDASIISLPTLLRSSKGSFVPWIAASITHEVHYMFESHTEINITPLLRPKL